ncbi:MAG TPA: aldo/keto reductase [Spirochaetia bacterium]|nr:aldo/keto reductase [Spirochaetia bacterium]
MSMTRKLGRLGEVSALGMGCWAIGGPFWRGETPVGWGKVDDSESTRAIQRALDLGITFFDTANVYGAGHSERVLGKALGARRKNVVIATKFNAVFDEKSRQVTGADVTPAGIRSACEASLQRLGTDYVDLLQFHDNEYPADKALPIRDTLERLVSAGKVRAYGWSTDFPDRAEVFAAGNSCASIQFQLNVLDDNAAVIAVCERRGLAGINRGPLAMGLLTGSYSPDSRPASDDVRGARAPEWMKYFKDGRPSAEWMARRDAVRQVLESGGRTLAQGALAWLWARSPVTIPIPGFRTVKQVEENAAALARGPLSPEELGKVEGLLGRA